MMLRCRWFSLVKCRHIDVDLGFGLSKMQHSEVLFMSNEPISGLSYS